MLVWGILSHVALRTHYLTGLKATQGRKQRTVLSPCDRQGSQGPEKASGFHKGHTTD